MPLMLSLLEWMKKKLDLSAIGDPIKLQENIFRTVLLFELRKTENCNYVCNFISNIVKKFPHVHENRKCPFNESKYKPKNEKDVFPNKGVLVAFSFWVI